MLANIFLESFIDKRVINIREKYPIIIFDDESFLNIECSWRVRDSNSILLGCYEYDLEKTHKAMYKKLVDLLVGKKIKDIKCMEPISDLIIEFEGKLYLELLCNSGIYENWTLSDGREFELISFPGGRI